MKFFTPLFTVLATSSVLSLSIPSKRDMMGVEDDYSYLGINPIVPIKEECKNAFEKIVTENKECTIGDLIGKDLDTIKGFCDAFYTEKCQNFFATKYSELPECKDSVDSSLILMENIISINYYNSQAQCAMDGNGNFCPLTDIGLSKRTTSTMKEDELAEKYNEAVKDTCKSQKCIDAYLAAHEGLEKSNKIYMEEISKLEAKGSKLDSVQESYYKTLQLLYENETVKKAVEYLNSKECEETEKSSAISSMTYPSVLLVTLVLLLVSL